MLPGFPKPLMGKSGPQFISQSNARVNGTTLTVAVPTGVQNGDFLVAFVFATAVNTTLAMSGWTLLYQTTSGAPKLAIYTKVASGEPSTYTATSSQTTNYRVSILAFRKAATAVQGAISQTITATVSAPAITGTGGILLAAFASNATTTPATPPSGMTLISDSSADPGAQTVYIYMLSPGPVGSTGAKTMVWSSSTASGAILVEIT